MLENLLETGVNAALFKNEKIADQALSLLPSPAVALAWESGYISIPELQPLNGWRFPVEQEAVTALKSLQATTTTTTTKKNDGKNEEAQLLLLVIGNRDVNSHLNI